MRSYPQAIRTKKEFGLDVRLYFKRDARPGTTVRATSIDERMAAEMVMMSSLNSRPARPPIKRKGKIAARLVVVEAIMALLTSFAAFIAGW